MAWYRNDKTAVTEALRRGERPDLATTMASGPLDELVALHEELGIFAILDEVQVQVAGAQSLYQRQLVRGKVYAVDGSGLGDDFRLVALVCVSATRPIIVAWRLLSGPASEKGKEAAVTRQLVEQVLEVAGPQAIGLRLSDALYADGPLLAWLKYSKGIDARVAFAR